MKVITDIEEANSLLKEYVGSTAQICMFSTSLRRLAIRLLVATSEEVVYIVGIGCKHIEGPFDWKNACLTLSAVQNSNGNLSTKIVDADVGFKLITSGGFTLAKGDDSEFGESFEDFIKQKNAV